MFKITQASLEAAAYLFERARGQTLSKNEGTNLAAFFDKTVKFNEVKAAIIYSIKNDALTPTLKASAVWALGKLFEKDLKLLFISLLKKEIEKGDDFNSDLLYQIMIALDNLQEVIFNQKGSYSILERGKNLRDAKAYLNSIK